MNDTSKNPSPEAIKNKADRARDLTEERQAAAQRLRNDAIAKAEWGYLSEVSSARLDEMVTLRNLTAEATFLYGYWKTEADRVSPLNTERDLAREALSRLLQKIVEHRAMDANLRLAIEEEVRGELENRGFPSEEIEIVLPLEKAGG